MPAPGNPNTTGPAKPAATAPQQVRRLKKGELLFAEGENSRAMYFLKNGMIRIFKKKGDSVIEIDTIHSGQVVGEMAFLDGNPRSASGEALTDCDLVEVSGPAFMEVLARMPDWLKILLKTVVGRLRTASTRIRQLETASTAFDYSSKDGKRSSVYVYLSPIDVMKIATGLLLVASRNGTTTSGGINVRVGLLQRYTNQIMGVPVAKITTFMDILEQCGITATHTEENATKVVLEDIDFLEQMITYLNEENLVEPSKRHDVSLRGFLIMSLIAKHLDRFGVDPTTGLKNVNLAEIRKLETAATGKEPFRVEEFPELVKLGYATNLNIKSQEEIFTTVKPDTFLQNYRLQRVAVSIQAINEQKRKAGGPAR
ncbi:MAG: hypothetical protein A2X94_03090 [Bdellovibrionales bacterium GWB1_55_8]|nr:MAG: hypothetical protein A2X94_03090 [Bdellovibrionales bacterium GWB1_55_8]